MSYKELKQNIKEAAEHLKEIVDENVTKMPRKQHACYPSLPYDPLWTMRCKECRKLPIKKVNWWKKNNLKVPQYHETKKSPRSDYLAIEDRECNQT